MTYYLSDCKNWKAVHFKDRTIVKSDLCLMGFDQRLDILDTEVEAMETPGHYRAI